MDLSSRSKNIRRGEQDTEAEVEQAVTVLGEQVAREERVAAAEADTYMFRTKEIHPTMGELHGLKTSSDRWRLMRRGTL